MEKSSLSALSSLNNSLDESSSLSSMSLKRSIQRGLASGKLKDRGIVGESVILDQHLDGSGPAPPPHQCDHGIVVDSVKD